MRLAALDKFYNDVVTKGCKTKQIALWYALAYLMEKNSEVSTNTTALSALTGIARNDIPAIFDELQELELVNGEIIGENLYCEVTGIIPSKPKVSKKFTPPTVDEVKAYCKQHKYKVDADQFVNFYAAKGWVVGKSPMKDWQAAVRTWVRKRNETRKVELG